MKFISLIHCTPAVPGAGLEERELFGPCWSWGLCCCCCCCLGLCCCWVFDAVGSLMLTIFAAVVFVVVLSAVDSFEVFDAVWDALIIGNEISYDA